MRRNKTNKWRKKKTINKTIHLHCWTIARTHRAQAVRKRASYRRLRMSLWDYVFSFRFVCRRIVSEPNWNERTERDSDQVYRTTERERKLIIFPNAVATVAAVNTNFLFWKWSFERSLSMCEQNRNDRETIATHFHSNFPIFFHFISLRILCDPIDSTFIRL